MKILLKKWTAGLFRRKKTFLWLTVVVAALCLPHMVFAADGETIPTAGADSATVKALVEVLALGIRFLNSLLWPFLLVLGDLMDTDMILGPGMEDRMVNIYNQTRALANIGFVLMLLFMALYNTLGLGGEGELAIKTGLPKVILGVILVNFTLPIGRVALDVTNVGVNVAFGLPSVVEDYDFAADLEDFTKQVCYKAIDPETGEPTQWWLTTDKDVPIQTSLFCSDTTTEGTVLGDDGQARYDGISSLVSSTYFQDLNKNNLGIIMSVNMGRLGALELLKKGVVEDFSDLSVNMIFAVVMYVVFAISYVVMGIVLIVRVFVLWIALALSPVAVLIYVIPQIKEWAGGGGDLSKKVIKHLIAPIPMGVAMSMGFLLMDAWNSTAQGAGGNLATLGTTQAISSQFLISGVDDLPKLVLAIASVVVVWTGVFAATTDTYAEGITSTIKNLGQDAAKALGAAALSIPTLSVSPKGGEPIETSPLAVYGLVQNQLRRYSSGTAALEGMDELASKLGLPSAGIKNRDPLVNSQNLLSNLRSVQSNNRVISDEVARNMVTEAWQLSESSKLDDSTKRQIAGEKDRLLNELNSGDSSRKSRAVKDLAQIVLTKFTADKMPDVKNLSDIQKAATAINTGGSITVGDLTTPTARATAPAAPTAAPTGNQNLTPEQLNQVKTVYDRVTGPNSQISAQLGSFNTAVRSRPATLPAIPGTTQAHVDALPGQLDAARTAIRTLQVTPNNGNREAARTALNTVIGTVRTLQADSAFAPVPPATSTTEGDRLNALYQELDQVIGALDPARLTLPN